MARCAECFPDHHDAGMMHKRDRMKAGAFRHAGYDLAIIVEHEFVSSPLEAVIAAMEGGD